MWTYNQANGRLSRNGELAGSGYSGSGAGKNNPKAEAQASAGPIPRGLWRIEFPPFQSEACGPECLRLAPADGTETYGRGGFLIHGDSMEHPGSASHGCIVLPRPARLAIAASGDGELEVV